MFSFYVRGQALWIWMALLSVVTYEPHRIYKHCDTRKRAYCAVRACLHSISKTVGSFRVKEAPLSSLMAHWRNLKRGRTLLLMAPASFLLFVVCCLFFSQMKCERCIVDGPDNDLKHHLSETSVRLKAFLPWKQVRFVCSVLCSFSTGGVSSCFCSAATSSKCGKLVRGSCSNARAEKPFFQSSAFIH